MIDMTFKEGLMKKWREENDEGKLPRYIWKEKRYFRQNLYQRSG